MASLCFDSIPGTAWLSPFFQGSHFLLAHKILEVLALQRDRLAGNKKDGYTAVEFQGLLREIFPDLDFA